VNRAVKRLTLFGALPLVGLLAVLGAAIAWLLDSESGARWIAARVLPAEISYRELSGTLNRGLHIEGLRIRLEGVDVDIGQVEGRWQLLSVLGGQFHLEQLTAADVDVTLKETDKPEEPPGPWPSLRLPFPVTLKLIALTNLRIHQGDSTTEIRSASLSAVLSPLHAHIQRFSVAMPAGKVSLSGRLGTSYPYPANLGIAWWLDQADQHFAGEGTLSGPITALKIEHQISSPFVLASKGSVDVRADPQVMAIVPQQVAFALNNHWQGLDLTSYGVSAISAGSLELGGTASDYSLILDTVLAPSAAPVTEDSSAEQETADVLAMLLRDSESPPHLTLRAQGSLEEARIASLQLVTDRGQATVNGTVGWVDGIRWDAALSAAELDTSMLAPQFPALLSATINSSGQWLEGQLQTQLDIASLTGKVRDHSLEGSGRMRVHYGAAEFGADIDDLKLALGANRLDANGVVGATSDLNWRLSADNLAALAPQMGGRLRGEGSVSGTLQDIRLRANLDGADVRLPGVGIESLSLRLTPSAGNQHSLDARITGIDGAGLNDAELRIDAQGSPQDHRLRAAFAGMDNAVELSVEGGYNAGAWQGALARLDISESPIGAWHMSEPAQLQLGAENVRVSGLCLAQDDSRLCADVAKQGETLSTKGRIAALDLALVAPWLPQEASIQGQLDGRFDISADNGVFNGNYNLESSGGLLRYETAGDDAFETVFDLTANGNVAKNTLVNDARLSIADTGEIQLHLETGLDAPHRLAGNLNAQLPSLQWLQALTTAIEEPEGSIQLGLTIAGDASSPQLTGEASMQDIALTLPAAGIHLSDGNGRLTLAADEHWQMAASIKSGQEPLAVSGAGRLGTGAENALELSVQGNNVVLVDLPDTRVAVSPDLRVALADSALSVRGNLGIPSAHLVIRPQPEGATTVSADEEVIPAEEVDAAGLAVAADVRIQLGDDVRLEAFGLNTRLTGNLRLRQQSPNPPRADGTIALEDGTYEAYGQKLEVTRGLLLFQGAVDNPGLNIVATRETPSATVGLEIGGSAQDIKSEVFSNPAMPSTDALTILVTGKPLADLNESDTNAVANIATSLGIAQSQGITNRLQSATGLDVVSLQGGDTYVDSSLVVGKYLSSKLFVSYVQNLFTPQGSFVLQYTLGKRLGLKAESGEYQSIDLLYKIEH